MIQEKIRSLHVGRDDDTGRKGKNKPRTKSEELRKDPSLPFRMTGILSF